MWIFNRVLAHCLVFVCLHLSLHHELLERRHYILFLLYLWSIAQCLPHSGYLMCVLLNWTVNSGKTDIWSGMSHMSWHIEKFLRTPKWALKLSLEIKSNQKACFFQASKGEGWKRECRPPKHLFCLWLLKTKCQERWASEWKFRANTSRREKKP